MNAKKVLESQVVSVVSDCFHTQPTGIKYLGGGFYGKVFLAAFDKPPYQAVVKLYKFDDMNKREALQLETLAQHSTLKMPHVYHVHEKTALVMEFLQGVNAGFQFALSAKTRDRIGGQIIENLLAYHAAPHEGYGELDAGNYNASWHDHYREVMKSTLKKGEVLLASGQIKQKTFDVCHYALERYDSIFQVEPEGAGLVHGDYNTLNILLDEDKRNAVAVIDPFNCSWADPEYDLYQLKKLTGKSFGLLEKYKQQHTLSPNYECKIKCYELFTEIAHYHDAQINASLSRYFCRAIEVDFC